MKIQQHDGVVVEATMISAGLRQAHGEGGVSREGEGGARGLGAAALPPPTIYRVCRGAPAPGGPISKGGGGPGGGLSPQPNWAPPPLGFPTLGAGGAKGGTPAH